MNRWCFVLVFCVNDFALWNWKYDWKVQFFLWKCSAKLLSSSSFDVFCYMVRFWDIFICELACFHRRRAYELRCIEASMGMDSAKSQRSR